MSQLVSDTLINVLPTASVVEIFWQKHVRSHRLSRSLAPVPPNPARLDSERRKQIEQCTEEGTRRQRIRARSGNGRRAPESRGPVVPPGHPSGLRNGSRQTCGVSPRFTRQSLITGKNFLEEGEQKRSKLCRRLDRPPGNR